MSLWAGGSGQKASTLGRKLRLALLESTSLSTHHLSALAPTGGSSRGGESRGVRLGVRSSNHQMETRPPLGHVLVAQDIFFPVGGMETLP